MIAGLMTLSIDNVPKLRTYQLQRSLCEALVPPVLPPAPPIPATSLPRNPMKSGLMPFLTKNRPKRRMYQLRLSLCKVLVPTPTPSAPPCLFLHNHNINFARDDN